MARCKNTPGSRGRSYLCPETSPAQPSPVTGAETWTVGGGACGRHSPGCSHDSSSPLHYLHLGPTFQHVSKFKCRGDILNHLLVLYSMNFDPHQPSPTCQVCCLLLVAASGWSPGGATQEPGAGCQWVPSVGGGHMRGDWGGHTMIYWGGQSGQWTQHGCRSEGSTPRHREVRTEWEERQWPALAPYTGDTGGTRWTQQGSQVTKMRQMLWV